MVNWVNDPCLEYQQPQQSHPKYFFLNQFPILRFFDHNNSVTLMKRATFDFFFQQMQFQRKVFVNRKRERSLEAAANKIFL